MALVVRVPSVRRIVGSAARAERIRKADRRAIWTGWLEQGRYRSVRELAEAVGKSAALVSRVLRGLR